VTDSNFDDGQLMGFLLGALDDGERDRIARRLMIDDDLRERFMRLQETVELFDSIRDEQNSGAGKTGSGDGGSSDFDTHDTAGDEGRATPSSLLARTLQSVENASRRSWLSGGMSAAEANDRETPRGRSSWYDLAAAVAICVVLVSLLIPGLFGSREQSRQVACADRLAHIGDSIHDFASSNHRDCLPPIPSQGPLSFAGVYAIQLFERDLISGLADLTCPTYRMIQSGILEFPTQIQMLQMDRDEQDYWRHVAGGTYASNLGHFDGQRYTPVQLQGRSHFAILSDLPLVFVERRGNVSESECQEIDGWSTRDDDWSPDFAFPRTRVKRTEQSQEGSMTRRTWLVHRGQGMNVLFEDGHVQFIRITDDSELMQELFQNRLGLQTAGLDREDCVLAPSHRQPVPPLSELKKSLFSHERDYPGITHVRYSPSDPTIIYPGRD
jgi:prepilin-type processing-associated H-X9-DG protein